MCEWSLFMSTTVSFVERKKKTLSQLTKQMSYKSTNYGSIIIDALDKVEVKLL